MENEIHDYKFEVDDSAKLNVKNIRGKIDIKKGIDNVIKIQVIKYPETGNDEETKIIVHQESDSTVEAKVNFDGKDFLRVRRPCRIEFIIEVPANCQVNAKNVSGDVILDNVDGDHRLGTVSGSIRFSNVKADVFASKSVSGGVLGDNLVCKTAEIKSVSGSVILSEMAIDEMDLSTVSGSIKYNGALGSGRHDIGSVSGSINLKIPGKTNLDFKASSISGKLNSDLNIKFTSISKRSWAGKLNDGGALIKLKTISGSMNINTL